MTCPQSNACLLGAPLFFLVWTAAIALSELMSVFIITTFSNRSSIHYQRDVFYSKLFILKDNFVFVVNMIVYYDYPEFLPRLPKSIVPWASALIKITRSP